MHSQDGTAKSGLAPFEFGPGGTAGGRRGGKSKPVKASIELSQAAANTAGDDAEKVKPKGTRFASKDR